MSSPLIITIDGPSGSGKGTLSQMLARHFAFHLLDSGALYRLVALAALNAGINLEDQAGLEQVALTLDVSFPVGAQGVRTLLAGEDVSDAIRAETVGMAASRVAAYVPVRAALLERQRAFAQLPGLVADGRDMGTTVFPTALVKVFLTASAEARADRRCKQLAEKGTQANWDDVVRDIRERDERDTQRSASPLVPAPDAVIIDSTQMSIAEVFAQILALVKTAQS